LSSLRSDSGLINGYVMLCLWSYKLQHKRISACRTQTQKNMISFLES